MRKLAPDTFGLYRGVELPWELEGLPDRALVLAINAFDNDQVGAVVLISTETGQSLTVTRKEAFAEFSRRAGQVAR